MPRLLRTPADLTAADWRALYDGFTAPIAELDCGQKCAVHNPNGQPFCCDICHAIPAAYDSEWEYLRQTTDLWHPYHPEECASSPDAAAGRAVTEMDLPSGMIPLACLGARRCQRANRLLSCRAFPFFPYITRDYRFPGLSIEWEFAPVCWVISNLSIVSPTYRQQFLHTFDLLLATFDDLFENYAAHSERLRAHYAAQKRRFPLLHRNGGIYLVSPRSERLQRVEPHHLPRYGFYRLCGDGI
jgi:hypothetical protein